MLLIAKKLSDLKFRLLMDVYQEGLEVNAEEFYPNYDKNAGLHLAEQDFYTYLSDVFFETKNAVYALWVQNDQYISAVRFEPYKDGVLLEALETNPKYRRLGYGKMLVKSCLLSMSGNVYSHVSKNNEHSLALHRSCGFKIILDWAEYIDGTIHDGSYTLCWQSDKK